MLREKPFEETAALMRQHPTEASKQAAFDPEVLQVMSGAMNDAWRSLSEADTTLSDAMKAGMAREILARRILELATEGERDQQRLRDGALAAIKTEANRDAPGPKGRFLSYLPAMFITIVLAVGAIVTVAWLAILVWGTVKLLRHIVS